MQDKAHVNAAVFAMCLSSQGGLLQLVLAMFTYARREDPLELPTSRSFSCRPRPPCSDRRPSHS